MLLLTKRISTLTAFSIPRSTDRVKGIMRTSGEIDFRFRLKLKITLVESTYPSQRPQCPSLSPHFFLAKSHRPSLCYKCRLCKSVYALTPGVGGGWALTLVESSVQVVMFWFSLYPVPHKFGLTHIKNIRLTSSRFLFLKSSACGTQKYIMQAMKRNEEGMGIDRMFQ